MLSPTGDSIRRGQRGSRQQGAMPMYKGKENDEVNNSGIFAKYNEYSRAFELDVADTIDKDLQRENNARVIAENKELGARDRAYKAMAAESDIQKMRKMML